MPTFVELQMRKERMRFLQTRPNNDVIADRRRAAEALAKRFAGLEKQKALT